MNNDIYELLGEVCHLPGADERDLEDELFDQYGIDVDCFQALIDRLLPLCRIEKSPLTGKFYQGFGSDTTWLYRQELPQQ